jgi:predicted RNA-binding Zn-ribbon protein involved in translation (DUF1610 family)
MVWDREIHGPALVDGHPVVGFSKEHAIKIRDALNEPALAGEVGAHALGLIGQTLMPGLPEPGLDRKRLDRPIPDQPSLVPPHLAASPMEAKVRSDAGGEQPPQFAMPSSYAERGIDTYGIRPDCPACGMHMIVVNEVSIVPGKRTYECLRCGHVAQPQSRGSRVPLSGE